MCEAPLAALATAEEEQNNVEWIPKLNAQSILGSIQHCFAPLQPSRGRQEELHTQFASWMETKVRIGLAHTTPELWSHFLYLLTHFMDLQTNVHNPMTHFLDLLDISWTFWTISWSTNILWICPGIMSGGQVWFTSSNCYECIKFLIFIIHDPIMVETFSLLFEKHNSWLCNFIDKLFIDDWFEHTK